jgi:F420-0:gamma-glutamyl ligase-like protein
MEKFMDISKLIPNENKNLVISTKYGDYYRYPVKTKVVVKGDDLKEILSEYAMPYVEDGDMIFMSEKIVAISQGRSFDIDDIKPSRLANFLCKFVHKSPYGIGLGIPQTMELAIREIGKPKILFAAFCSAVTKPFGKRGVFYQIVGDKARAIDGPCDYTLPPYNHHAKLAPKNPDKVAADLAKHTGCGFVVIDANDLGVEILGRSSKDIDIDFCKAVFKDNPLGQGSQSTPIAIVRKVK